MKKTIVFSSLAIFLYAQDDYVPLSKMSNDKKTEYNFVNKKNIIEAVEKENYTSVTEKNNERTNSSQDSEIKDEIIQEEKIGENSTPINKNFVKEYKKENILNNEKKYSQNSFNKDFTITPKIIYMNISTTIEKEDIEKTHEITPELLFTYKNHIIKFDYLESNVEKKELVKLNFTDFNLDTKWYRLAYLYKYLNANIGLAYNYLKLDGEYYNVLENDWYVNKGNEKFLTLEAHFQNSQDKLLVEYGGFYGKNDSDIKSAYEYYLTLGYKIFSNDNLIFNAGYKNRTIDYDDGLQIEYKGPVIGISSTF